LVKSFEELLHPLSLKEFKEKYFEKTFALVRGNTFDRINSFSLDVFEQILWEHEAILGTNLRVNHKGKAIQLPGRASGKDIFRWAIDKYAEGATLILNGIERIYAPSVELARSMDAFFGGIATLNAFLTPKNSQGFLPHFDTHDVFIYQTDGAKRWKIFDQRIELPVLRQIHVINQETIGEAELDFVLSQSEVLYIPRGVVHGSQTEDDFSLHVTLGIRPLRWITYIQTMVDIISEMDIKLRKSISFDENFDDDLENIIEVIEHYSKNKRVRKLTIERTKEIHISSLRPTSGHHIKSINKLNAKPGVNNYSVRFAKELIGLSEYKDKLRLLFPGVGIADDKNLQPGVIEMSVIFRPVVEEIIEKKNAFTAKDLRVDLFDTEKLDQFLRKLAQEGLLIIH
jgi:hypothetical protein